MNAEELERVKIEAEIALHAQQISWHNEQLKTKEAHLRLLLAAKNETTKNNKQRRVYVDGCFDIMHCGHYNALRQAKKLAGPNGVVVAGVHSCEDISAAKGPPVFTDEERLALVHSCKFVDEVVFGTPYTTTLEVMDRPDVNCEFCAHGDDLAPMYEPIRDAGRLLIVKRTEGTSTTDLVGRLLLMTRTHIERPRSGSGDLDFSSSAGLDSIRSSKMSEFLPTSRRIAAFGSGRVPQPGDKVVYLDGTFDLYHPGHVMAIKKARELGDFLYLGLHDDQTISSEWGENFPIMNLHERALCVLASKYVDEVIIGAPWVVSASLLETLNVNIVAGGGIVTKLAPSSKEDSADRCYSVPITRGIYRSLELGSAVKKLTGDMIIQRIVKNRVIYEARNRKKVKSENDYMDGNYGIKQKPVEEK